MSELYNEFEDKYKFSWFSAGWVDVEVKPSQAAPVQAVNKKDLQMLESELSSIQETLENIELKQLRLANLAKFYQV